MECCLVTILFFLADFLMELTHYSDNLSTIFDYFVLFAVLLVLVQWVNTDYYVRFLVFVVQEDASRFLEICYYMLGRIASSAVGLIATVTGQLF